MYPYENSPNRKVLKWFTVLPWVSLGATVGGGVVLAVASEARGEEAGVAAVLGLVPFLLGLGGILAASILGYILLYRGWKSIQALRRESPQDYDMPTPGAAVGLCFVPFFSCYWIFVAAVGLANRMNRFLDRRALAVPRVSSGLAIATCVLVLIPYVGLVPSAICAYIFLLQVARATDSIWIRVYGWTHPAPVATPFYPPNP